MAKVPRDASGLTARDHEQLLVRFTRSAGRKLLAECESIRHMAEAYTIDLSDPNHPVAAMLRLSEAHARVMIEME